MFETRGLCISLAVCCSIHDFLCIACVDWHPIDLIPIMVITLTNSREDVMITQEALLQDTHNSNLWGVMG